MGWIQMLHDTYQHCQGNEPPGSRPLMPISHTTQRAHIEITINGKGEFRRARLLTKEESTTLIPCTEESGGRAGKKPVNHPLCDKLQYIAGDFIDFGGDVTVGFSKDPREPYRTYLTDLKEWASSPNGHSKLIAVLKYVQKGQVIQDLVNEGILPANGHSLLKAWQGEKKQAPTIFKTVGRPDDAFVRWLVEDTGVPCSGTWEDPTLIDAWVKHYASRQTKKGICMVTGMMDTSLAIQHPAKIRNAGDKAKLISSNDSSGFTFRGRFLDAGEACGVGFEITQKAHAALRWLIERQAYRNGDQVIVSWSVAGKPLPDPFKDSLSLFLSSKDIAEPVAEPRQTDIGDAGQSFAKRLNRTIAGYRSKLGAADDIVVMGLDSATPGRMAITFYRELKGFEFLDRIQSWHEQHAWQQNFGKESRFVGTPAPREIAEAAFGRRLDDKLRKATVERLLPCIVDGRPLPRDLVDSVVRRTCNRVGLDKWEWEKNLGIACSLFKGLFKEREYQMTLETDRTSRDYLYGRLLAIAEHVEGRALYVSGEKRDTTAAKLMQRFADRPTNTWRIIEPQLMPYMSRLRTKRPAFLREMEKLLDEVISSFKSDDFLDDRKLSGEFLLGYHCQRQALNPPKTDATSGDEDVPTE
jgi:CRISPR-associated protein Csd1